MRHARKRCRPKPFQAELEYGVCREDVRVGILMQATHVAANDGNSRQSRVPVDQGFHLGCIEGLFPHQVDEHPRVEVAAARAHDHTTGRRQAHARIDGVTSPHSCDACAVAQMGNNDAIRHIASQLVND